MLVFSLITSTFREKMEIRFDNRVDLEYLSGACLFVMALETCNASVAHDMSKGQATNWTASLLTPIRVKM